MSLTLDLWKKVTEALACVQNAEAGLDWGMVDVDAAERANARALRAARRLPRSAVGTRLTIEQLVAFGRATRSGSPRRGVFHRRAAERVDRMFVDGPPR